MAVPLTCERAMDGGRRKPMRLVAQIIWNLDTLYLSIAAIRSEPLLPRDGVVFFVCASIVIQRWNGV
jgi:hypothetical protein